MITDAELKDPNTGLEYYCEIEYDLEPQYRGSIIDPDNDEPCGFEAKIVAIYVFPSDEYAIKIAIYHESWINRSVPKLQYFIDLEEQAKQFIKIKMENESIESAEAYTDRHN